MASASSASSASIFMSTNTQMIVRPVAPWIPFERERILGGVGAANPYRLRVDSPEAQPVAHGPLFASAGSGADRNRRVAHSESLLAYLEQSTHPRDDLIRANLELMYEQLPPAAKAELFPRLADRNDARFKDALTELVVHQLLLELGRTDIEVSPVTVGARRSDYRLSQLPLQLEVARVGESANLLGEKRRRHQVVEALNKVTYGRYSLSVTMYSGTDVPSVAAVREEILAWLASLDADGERRQLEQERSYQPPTRRFVVDDWSFDVVARPLRRGSPTEEAIGQFVAPRRPGRPPGERDPEPVTTETVRAKLKDKRSQHRGLAEPLLIVLDASAGMVSDRELADAFYGARPRVGWDDPVDRGALWATEQRSGHRSSRLKAGPDIVGVLVLDDVQLTGLNTIKATMWIPPGTSSPLSGPWRTARWQAPPPGDLSASDIVITPPRGLRPSRCGSSPLLMWPMPFKWGLFGFRRRTAERAVPGVVAERAPSVPARTRASQLT